MTRRSGFTLLELLVSIVMISLLTTIGARVFIATFTARDRLRESTREVGGLRRAYEVISRDFHSAVTAPEDSGVVFGLVSGGNASLNPVFQFASAVSEPLLVGRQANETALLQYLVEPDPRTGEPALWRVENAYPVPEGTTPGQVGQNSEGDTRATLLLRGVTNINYLFYSTSQTNWVDTWDGEAGLPTGVRMDLFFGESNDPNKPPRQETLTFSIPSAAFINSEAAAAASAGTTAQ